VRAVQARLDGAPSREAQFHEAQFHEAQFHEAQV
jgi:hypothetical protein